MRVCETQLKVQLLSPFSFFKFKLPPVSFSLSFFSSIEASSPSFLSKAHSWWQSSFFHGLFPSGWCLLSPLLLYLPLHLHGGKSPLKDLIEAQRSSLRRSSISKLTSHMVSTHSVDLVAAKAQAITQWPIIESQRALRDFLGLSKFYRLFIRGYATIRTPRTSLLAKDNFIWSDEAQIAFNSLKDAITTSQVLLLPNFELTFILEIDAFSIGMGIVLSQQGHPISFFNNPFSSKLYHASTYVRELFVITAAVKKWRQYLLGHPFTILTNHKSLKELKTQVVQTPEQQMYLARLIGYDYTIQYRSGSSNVVADTLSRITENSSRTLLSLSVPYFIFLNELVIP